jgi:hypothetical protein
VEDPDPTLTEKKDDRGTPGPAGTLSGNCSGPETLRRKQLESNHRENRATGKEGEADHRGHKHSPQKIRKAVCP